MHHCHISHLFFVLAPGASYFIAFPLILLRVESMGKEKRHTVSTLLSSLKTLLSNELESSLYKLLPTLVSFGDMSGFSFWTLEHLITHYLHHWELTFDTEEYVLGLSSYPCILEHMTECHGAEVWKESKNMNWQSALSRLRLCSSFTLQVWS